MTDANFAVPQAHAEVLVNPKAYADGRIFDTYAWLRENNDFGFAQSGNYDPFWVATRYNDVRMISRDNTTFPYGDRPSMLTDRASETFIRSISGGKPVLAPTLIASDPPIHMKYRLLTQAWFAPKMLKALDDRIADIADDAIRAFMKGSRECDFVADVALYYPLRVIMEIIGIPQTDLPQMLRLTQEIFAPADPDSMPIGVDQTDPAFLAQAMKSTLNELDRYFKSITEDRRANPRNDVATIIANAKIDDRGLTDEEELGYYTILATAGHDTTSSSTAAGVYQLATQDGLLQRLQTQPEMLGAFIEEAIRWATPVKTFMRSASRDVELRGRKIKAGDWIMLCYASANRDEAVIQDGGAFDIDRPKFDHIAFGYGPHVCLGQHLARREMTAFFSRLLPRMASVELTGEVALSQSFFVNGLKHLPIRVTWSEEGQRDAA